MNTSKASLQNTMETNLAGYARGTTVLLSVLSGMTTLTCCALPALFISLGMGASLVSLVSAAPWLISLSAHKHLVFGVAVLLLAIAALLQFRARNEPCRIEGFGAKYCKFFRRFSYAALGISALTISIGALFAFVPGMLFLIY